MQENKIDPRSIRTKQLLLDAFTKLTREKDFKDITIKDITNEATVNRATFYSHFQDKYDLMDACIKKEILESIVKHLEHYNTLNEHSIINIFLTLTEFHTRKNTDYSLQCRRSMEPFNSVFEQEIKKNWESCFILY